MTHALLSPEQLTELQNTGFYSVDVAELEIPGVASGMFTMNTTKQGVNDSYTIEVVRRN